MRFASLSADGRVLATADIRTIRVWDARQGRLFASRAYGRGVFFTGLTLSPDARLLAVGNGGILEVLRVPAVDAARDTPDALADAVFRPALRQPQRPTFSPDGRFFAALGTGGGLTRVWTVGDWTERATHDGGVALAFSPNGEHLFIAGRGRIHAVVPDARGPDVATLAIPPAPVVAFSQDGSHVAVADATSALMWRWSARARAWESVATLTHQGRPTTIAVNGDGPRICVGSEDGTARIWTVADQREVLRLTHGRTVTATVSSGDASVIATAGNEGLASLWETTLDASARRLPHGTPVPALAFAADDLVWTLADDGQLRSWSGPGGPAAMSDVAPAMSDGEIPHTLFAAGFDPTTRHAAVAISDGTIFLWNLATGTSREWTVDDEVEGIAVSPTGDRVALTGERLEVWAVGAEPTDDRQVPLEAFAAQAAAFSADGRFLAAAAPSGIRVYDVRTGRVARHARIRGSAGRLVFSANGAILAVADDSYHLLLWRWQEPGAAPASAATEQSAIGALALGDRDRVVAYTVGGRVVVVRDLASHRELARLSEEAEVLALAFSPDGRQLGLASADGVARVVRWRPQDLIREAEQRLSPAR